MDTASQKLESPFTAHPNAVGETYLQHLVNAARIGARLIGCGVVCLVHAIFPFLFVDTGSREIRRLHAHLKARRPDLD